MPEPIDFGYLFDLCAANGWKLVLPLLDDGRHALRVVDSSEVVIVGARFDLSDVRLDEAAQSIFDELHEKGHV